MTDELMNCKKKFKSSPTQSNNFYQTLMQVPEVVRIAIAIPTTPATKQTTISNSSRVVKTGTTMKMATL